MCHGGQFVYIGHVEKMSFFHYDYSIILGKHPLPWEFNNKCFVEKKVDVSQKFRWEGCGVTFPIKSNPEIKTHQLDFGSVEPEFRSHIVNITAT